jgi:hypothetical protein
VDVNDFHPLIQFTSEIEIDRRINYSDMTLIRQDNKIILNYYSKMDSSNRIVNFQSIHPFNMKFNTALAYAKRIKSLSHRQFYFSNIQMIINVLSDNVDTQKGS